MQIAVIATARKLAVLCWHLAIKDEDYTFARPSLTEKKLRALELRAGMPSHRGKKRSAAAYSLKAVPRRERELSRAGRALIPAAGLRPRSVDKAERAG
jgi:transposase